MRKISEIPEPDRPREKLLKKGANSLSDIELVAILLGKGTQKQDVMSVARRVLRTLDVSSNRVDLKDLQKIEGVGLRPSRFFHLFFLLDNHFFIYHYYIYYNI